MSSSTVPKPQQPAATTSDVADSEQSNILKASSPLALIERSPVTTTLPLRASLSQAVSTPFSQSGIIKAGIQQQFSSSGNKRQKKAAKKGVTTPASLQQEEAESSSLRGGVDSKYKDIPGVTEWLQAKKIENEQQQNNQASTNGNKKGGISPSILGLPLVNHMWKPPRIDEKRYQVDQLAEQVAIIKPIAINPEIIKEDTKDEIKLRLLNDAQPNSSLKNKRKHRRSNSSDNLLLLTDPVQRRRVKLMLEEDYDDHSVPTQQVVDMHKSSLEIKAEAKAQSKDQMQMTYNPHLIENNDEKFKSYMELVEFVMRETLSSCSGLWLKGSLVGYEEKALALLHQYDYNYDLAKFHILYPGVMAIPERRQEILHSLTEKELSNIVQDAVIDLRGCKTHEAEEALSNIRHAVENRISIEDLNYYQQVLKKLQIDVPEDVESEINRSREFSKQIRKRCGTYTAGGSITQQISIDKKMKMTELLEMQKVSFESYFVITPEMLTLNEYVAKAQAWNEKAILSASQLMSLKGLQNLLQEARAIPVNFEELYEQVRKRSVEGQVIVDKIYNTFTKVTKTRTQLSTTNKEELQTDSKSQEVQKELSYRLLLKEAEFLLITNPEINRLRDHMNEVDCWKARVTLFLEDHREQTLRKEVFQQLIRETSLFKIELDLTEDLQKRLEFIEWHEKALEIYKQIVDQDSEKPSFIKLQQVIADGEAKKLTSVQIPEIIFLVDLDKRALQKKGEIQKILQAIEEGTPQRLNSMIALRNEIRSHIGVQIETMKEFELTIEKTMKMVQKCQQYIERQEEIHQESSSTLLNEWLEFKEEIRALKITNSTFSRFNALLKPIMVWIESMRAIIKTYHKSLDLQQSFHQLSLLDLRPYLDDNIYQTDSDQSLQEPNQDVPDQHYLLLEYLITLAEGENQILMGTRDFQLLKDLQKRVQNWVQKAQEYEEVEASIEHLEALAGQNLPLPQEWVNMVSRRLKRAKWMKRIQEVKTAEKVKLKQLETLVKDSNHVDIQEDSKCKDEAEKLQAQLIQCRAWSDQYAAADINSQLAIIRLLDLGKATLTLNLDDYVDLKSFHHDFLEWNTITYQILNGPKSLEYNFEFLKKHLEQAIVLDINPQQIEVLKHLVDVCSQWKSIVSKVKSARELARIEAMPLPKIENQILFDADMKEEEKKESNEPEHQEELYDNKQYCICRRGDDGLLFMIECDSCKEWFHGPCVGITEDESLQHQSYICIACAQAFHRFDPLVPQPIFSTTDDNQQTMIVNPAQLKVFSVFKRVGMAFLLNIIEEGNLIPIYLEELQDLIKQEERIALWKNEVTQILSLPLTPEGNSNDSSSSSEGIINTKTNQVEQSPQAYYVKNEDEISSKLLKFMLESESFPVEMPDQVDSLLRMIRIRKWHSQVESLLEQLEKPKVPSLSNNARAAIKKSIKSLINDYQQIIEEASPLQDDLLDQQLDHTLSCLKQAMTHLSQQQLILPIKFQKRQKPASPQDEQSKEAPVEEVVIEQE